MATLESLIASGRIVDLMIAVLLAETIAILAYRRLRGGGIAPVPLLTNLAAGGSLMLALRAAVTGGGWGSVALWLLAALVFHVADLRQRWERAPA